VAKIVTYSIIVTLFFLLLELFTVFYSQEPEAMKHFQYLLFGLEGHYGLVPWMWLSITLMCASIVVLLNSNWRRNTAVLAGVCVAVLIAIWIDKGLGLVIPGFIPAQSGEVVEYNPTLPEVMIMIGVWSLGGLVLALLYKVVLAARKA